MSDAAKVKLGVCNVAFNSSDLGYTSGNVHVTYSAESVEVNVDQEDVPIDELITTQTFEVVVPMAEYDLPTLAGLLPGATLVTDDVDPSKMKIELSGGAGASLLSGAKELVITPVGGDANDKVTLPHAAPRPSLDFAYEKENVRVYEVTFRALKGENGYVILGDSTAVAA